MTETGAGMPTHRAQRTAGACGHGNVVRFGRTNPACSRPRTCHWCRARQQAGPRLADTQLAEPHRDAARVSSPFADPAQLTRVRKFVAGRPKWAEAITGKPFSLRAMTAHELVLLDLATRAELEPPTTPRPPAPGYLPTVAERAATARAEAGARAWSRPAATRCRCRRRWPATTPARTTTSAASSARTTSSRGHRRTPASAAHSIRRCAPPRRRPAPALRPSPRPDGPPAHLSGACAPPTGSPGSSPSIPCCTPSSRDVSTTSCTISRLYGGVAPAARNTRRIRRASRRPSVAHSPLAHLPRQCRKPLDERQSWHLNEFPTRCLG